VLLVDLQRADRDDTRLRCDVVERACDPVALED
jgi:hypothetical protein